MVPRRAGRPERGTHARLARHGHAVVAGKPYDRLSDEYQSLLDRAYQALFDQSERFRTALAATGAARLTHTIGKSDPCETILTAEELCTRLERLRGGG